MKQRAATLQGGPVSFFAARHMALCLAGAAVVQQNLQGPLHMQGPLRQVRVPFRHPPTLLLSLVGLARFCLWSRPHPCVPNLPRRRAPIAPRAAGGRPWNCEYNSEVTVSQFPPGGQDF